VIKVFVLNLSHYLWRDFMKTVLRIVAFTALFALVVYAADDAASAIHGTVTKVDAAGKTITIKTKDGTEHTIHFVDKTVVKGSEITADAGKDSYKGVKEGSEVVVEYTKKGTVDTADEIDKLSKKTAKTTEGTVVKVGKDGKTVTIKTADGTEKTFETAGKGAEISAEDVGKGTEKGAKVTVTYTEKAGKAIGHFFEF
jgi:arginine repressor